MGLAEAWYAKQYQKYVFLIQVCLRKPECCCYQLAVLSAARRTQCIRDCCPAPMPTTCPFLVKHTEFDCVYLTATVATTRSLTASSGNYNNIHANQHSKLQCFTYVSTFCAIDLTDLNVN